MRQLRALACVAGIGVAAPAVHAADAALVAQLSAKGGCSICHAADKKVIGPSNRDIAAKYKGRADAVAVLTRSVRSGSAGVWGKVPMPPTPPAKFSDADLATLLGAILK